jgi:hypothetical protein
MRRGRERRRRRRRRRRSRRGERGGRGEEEEEEALHSNRHFPIHIFPFPTSLPGFLTLHML